MDWYAHELMHQECCCKWHLFVWMKAYTWGVTYNGQIIDDNNVIWQPIFGNITANRNLKNLAYDSGFSYPPPFKKSAFSFRGRLRKLAIEPK